MGIDRRASQHRVDPIDQSIRCGVFETLGLVVHVGPAHAKYLDQEQLDETVAPEHERGKFPSRRAQANPSIGLVVDQARFGERLDHGCRRARNDTKRRRQLPHRNELILVQS